MLLDPEAAGDEVAAVLAPSDSSTDSPLFTPDSGQAWVRLALALVIGSIGSVGMWSVVVVLPVVQAEFGATPRRCIAGLHAPHARLWSRQRRDRQDHRSLRHRHGDRARHCGPRVGLCRRRAFDHVMAIHSDSFSDRPRDLGDVRAADGGGLALVRSLSWPRGDHCCQRQLCRRRDLATGAQLGDSDLRLALELYRRGYFLRRDDGGRLAAASRPDRRGDAAKPP